MKKILFFGRPCNAFKHGNSGGENLRYAYTLQRPRAVYCGRCMMKVGNETNDEDLRKLLEIVPERTGRPRVSTHTDEALRQKQSTASMKWAKKNKDKTKEYSRRYYLKLKNERLQNNQPRKEDV